MRNIDFISPNYSCFCKIAYDYRDVNCADKCCADCVKETVDWLWEERETNWDEVKPFTRVKVRDSEDDQWYSNYYFVRVIVVESKKCFIVSTTDDVKDSGNELVIYNQCKLE